LVHLAQGQGAQGGAHSLQPATQQLLHLIPISPLELNLKSLASAHTSAIQPEMASCKCLDRLPIHAVMVLVMLLVSVFTRHRLWLLAGMFGLCGFLAFLLLQLYDSILFRLNPTGRTLILYQ
jgi:hypothetical protein